MKLLVLAGGFGTRLQAALPGTPKALAPIGGTPFLEFQIENWKAQGIRSFIFLLHYQAEQLNSFLDSVKNDLLKDCDVISLVEPTPMDTGGAVAYAVEALDLCGDFLVTNADTWLSAGIREMSESLSPSMAVIQLSDSSRYGLVQFDKTGLITAFHEKDSHGKRGWINAGLCRLSAELFSAWDGTKFSLEREKFPDLVRSGELKAVVINSDFIDIGIPEDYQRFCRWIENGRIGSLCK